MTPVFVEEPITFKKIEVPADIVRYCDNFTLDAKRKDLRYLDCVWMHMGYYGTPKEVMKEVRTRIAPPIHPIFE